MQHAFEVIFETGLKLGQTIARKLFPTKDDLDSCDTSLNSIGFDLMLGGDWKLADVTFEFAVNLKPAWVSSDYVRKLFLVNRCICLANLGKEKDCRNLLESVDWSAADPRFKLAELVLKRQFEPAGKLMARFKKNDPLDEVSFLEWPLFEEFRSTPHFSKAFRKVFKKDFVASSIQEVQKDVKKLPSEKASKSKKIRRA